MEASPISGYAASRRANPYRWANVAGRPWRVSVSGGAVEGRALRAKRSCQSSRQCSRHHVLQSQSARFFGGRHPHRHLHGFTSHHLEPVAPNLTPWPIAPQNRKTRDWFGRLWGRLRQGREGGRRARSRDWPENGAHSSWFAGGKTFLTLPTPLTSAAIADAGCIEQAERTVTFWPAFLRIEWRVGRTEQTSIRLKGKGRSGEASRKRPACPLRRTIDLSGWCGLAAWCGFAAWRGRSRKSRGEFGCEHWGGKQVLPEFQAEIPDPLAHDLPKFLPTRRMGTPTVRILLEVFICQNGFKGPAMQIQVQHIFGGKSRSGKLGDEQFIDHAPACFSDGWGSGCGGMTGDNQPHTRSTSGEGHLWAIVKGADGSTFWVGRHLHGRARNNGLDRGQIQERIVATAPDEAQMRVQDISEHSSVAIQAIHTHQDLGGEKLVRRRIPGDHLESLFQFFPVVAIARSPKCAHELMGMRLQNRGTRSHHFPSLASPVARSTDLIKTTMRRRKRWEVGECPLASRLFGPIHIHDHVLLTATIPQPARGRERRRSLQQVFLKLRAPRLHAGLIEGSKKARKGGARGQVMATKQRHEDFCTGSQTFIKPTGCATRLLLGAPRLLDHCRSPHAQSGGGSWLSGFIVGLAAGCT